MSDTNIQAVRNAPVHRQTLVVIGNGMVGHKLLEELVERGLHRRYMIFVFGEEPRLAYDRVHLSEFFQGKTAEELSLVKPGYYDDSRITVWTGDRVTAIDRKMKVVRSATGQAIRYDKLVLATGSAPFVPPIHGNDREGCFVYRTIEDLQAIGEYSKRAQVGAVVGGGLLGLEAANALKNMGLKTHVVEFAPRLMSLQLDEVGGALLKRKIEALGVSVHVSKSTTEILAERGRVAKMRFADQGELPVDMIVFSAGIRPRDELARASGIAVGERGGVVIDDRCRTSDPDIYALGECATYQNRTYGLVAPGYRMARALATTLAIGAGTAADEKEASFEGVDMSTKLKLMGVDVGSFGDAFATSAGAHVVSYTDTTAGIYKKLVLAPDKKTLRGGMLVGDATSYGQFVQMMEHQLVLPPAPEELILPERPGGGARSTGGGGSIEQLPATATICSCFNVTKGVICEAITQKELTAVSGIKEATKAGTGCGSCSSLLGDFLKVEMKKRGVVVTNHLCEHFPWSRQELYHLVRLHRIKDFHSLLSAQGKGKGCEICKPAVASILASAWNEHVLDRRHIPLQDTNDRFLANIQRDGTYSVVPRIAGGEVTPEKLIALGEVARKYGLYCKITGGQRVDLFGARLEHLPDIWSELIAAGFESGHAYGKALRTVKSCVGSTWCRYGVQDAVGLAIRVENRYKGLRSPHKLKSAVSGCARECAEAQSKDFGIIATENGYNLYLCGNGGMKPQHAVLFATDLDEETLVRYLDRFLMFYIRTADRLQRTAGWLNNLEGGVDYLRQVVIDDSLGIAAELEAQMAEVVGSYRCEWKEAVEDPAKRRQFRAFVNTPAPDPSVVFVEERAQPRPASWVEKAARMLPLVPILSDAE